MRERGGEELKRDPAWPGSRGECVGAWVVRKSVGAWVTGERMPRTHMAMRAAVASRAVQRAATAAPVARGRARHENPSSSMPVMFVAMSGPTDGCAMRGRPGTESSDVLLSTAKSRRPRVTLYRCQSSTPSLGANSKGVGQAGREVAPRGASPGPLVTRSGR